MISSGRRRWRIGSVSFLNAMPLNYRLADDPRVDLTLDVPARLSALLENDLVDVALIPVIDYFRLTAEALERHRHRPLVIVPGVSIASRSTVASVRVFCRAEYEVIRHVALDPASHTSNALARLILKDVYGVEAHYRWPTPDPDALDEESDAFLLIGDRCLAHDRREYYHVIDLGEAWQRYTHLPFVYAVWAARESADLDDLAAILAESKAAGLEHLDELSRVGGDRTGLSDERVLRYFHENVHWDLGPEELAGMQAFYGWASREELAPLHIPIRLLGSPDIAAPPLPSRNLPEEGSA